MVEFLPLWAKTNLVGADSISAPTVRGTMLVIPDKSLKQKIPEQTFEDFGADEGI